MSWYMSYTPNMAHYVPDGSKPGQTAQDPGSFNYSYNPNAYQYPQSSYPYCPQPYPQQLVPASYPQQHQYYQPQYVPSPRPDAKSHWYCDHGSAPPPEAAGSHIYYGRSQQQVQADDHMIALRSGAYGSHDLAPKNADPNSKFQVRQPNGEYRWYPHSAIEDMEGHWYQAAHGQLYFARKA